MVFRRGKLKDRQCNVQKKKDKRINNDLQSIHLKIKIKQHEPNPTKNQG
jgi:hypothetical protein